MAARIASRERSPFRLSTDSPFDRVWTTAALASAMVFAVIALLQTPRWPLLCVVVAQGAFWGTVFMRDPLSSTRGRRQYAIGALAVAGLAVVLIGMGHYPRAGLTTLALLGGSSPFVIRWIAAV